MFLFQPPTPTPYPTPDSLPLQMPDVSVWDMTDDAIQMWNTTQELGVAFQAIIIVGIVIFILMALFNYSKIISVVRND
ncbi:MAG: hypothetical protein AAF846_22220 [Chloroflexota bacterium]